MGFFKKIFKGIKKVVKGIGKVVQKVVKSKAFKVIAAVALAVVAPQLIPTVVKGISSAGAWAAKTIATGAKAAWTAAKAVGTGLKTFGSKVFQSVTNTISNGVNFMKTKLGFKPTITTVNPATDAVGSNFISAAQGKSFAAPAKKTLGETIIGGVKKVGTEIFEGVKEAATEEAKETVLDKIAGERREADLTRSPVYSSRIGSYDTSQGFENLTNLSLDIQSPYITYNQGQQLFGSPEPATGQV